MTNVVENMAAVAKKPTPRQASRLIPLSATGIPKCRVHLSKMIYNPELLVWRCAEPECKIVAYPRPEEGTPARPVVLSGTVALVTDKLSKRVFLKSVEHNYLIDITFATTNIEVRMDHGGTLVDVNLVLTRHITLNDE